MNVKYGREDQQRRHITQNRHIPFDLAAIATAKTSHTEVDRQDTVYHHYERYIEQRVLCGEQLLYLQFVELYGIAVRDEDKNTKQQTKAKPIPTIGQKSRHKKAFYQRQQREYQQYIFH